MDKTWKWVVYTLYLLCSGLIVYAIGNCSAEAFAKWIKEK